MTFLYVFVPPLKGSGPVINVLGLSGVIAIVAGMRMHRPRARSAWWCFAAGLALFWAGDVYTYSYPKLTGADVPFPSAGDAMYIAVYPALMLGLLILVRRRNRRADGPGSSTRSIISLGLALVSATVLIAPYVHDHSLRLLPKLVSVAYPVGDIVLLAAGIRLAVDTGRRRPAFYLVIASIVTLLVTDFIYGILTLHNQYHHQLWLDVGWISFYLLWGAAALHPSMDSLSDAGVERAPRLTTGRLALLAAATLVAPVLEYINVRTRHDPDLEFMIGASVVLFALVVGRMAGLVRQRERAAARERSLNATGERLVAATSLADIAAAGLSAAGALVGGDAHAFVARLYEGEYPGRVPRDDRRAHLLGGADRPERLLRPQVGRAARTTARVGRRAAAAGRRRRRGRAQHPERRARMAGGHRRQDSRMSSRAPASPCSPTRSRSPPSGPSSPSRPTAPRPSSG